MLSNSRHLINMFINFYGITYILIGVRVLLADDLKREDNEPIYF